MEENRNLNLEMKDSPDPLPPLIEYVSTQELECFDSLNKDTELDTHTVFPSLVVSQLSFKISVIVIFILLYHIIIFSVPNYVCLLHKISSIDASALVSTCLINMLLKTFYSALIVMQDGYNSVNLHALIE